MNQEIVTKKCSKCQDVKPITDFQLDKHTKDGYRSQCKSCIKIYKQSYRVVYKEKIKTYAKKYREEKFEQVESTRLAWYYNNRYRANESHKKWTKDNTEHIKEYNRNNQNKRHQQYLKNRDKNRESNRIRENLRCQTNISHRIKKCYRKRIWSALRGIKKSEKTEILIGCSIEQLKVHLERKFQDGMTWNNYGMFGWHVDHIIPCASFDLIDHEQQRKCFHYTNLQPLWAKDNLSKHDKLL